jgi:hypothetical protein
VLQRQLGTQRIRFEPADRALLAALLYPFPGSVLRELQLLPNNRLEPQQPESPDPPG